MGDNKDTQSSAGNVDAAKARALAEKLDYARHSRITHGVRVDLDYQEMDLARDALRFVAQPQTLPTRPDSIYSQFHLDNWTDGDFAKHSAATRKTLAYLIELETALAVTRPEGK